MRPLKIGIVSQYYSPEPVEIPAQLAAGLKSLGHEIKVLTAVPNYPEGKTYPGYSPWKSTRTVEQGVSITRVPTVPNHSSSIVGRMFNYLSFSLSSLIWGRTLKDCDVIYVYATQMSAAFAPVIWRNTRRTPFVLHIQDVWPDSITASGLLKTGWIGSLINRLLQRPITYAYHRASATIAISEGMKRLLLSRGCDQKTTHTVYNWASEPDLAESRSPGEKNPGETTFVYAGNLGEAQDLEALVEGALQLADQPGIRLILVGEGVMRARLEGRIAAAGSPNIEIRPRVTREAMEEYYEIADFHLITLRDDPLFEVTIPSKFQNAIARAVPVVTSVGGDTRAIVTDAGLGITVSAGDPSSYAAGLRRGHVTSVETRLQMGSNARDYYYENMSIDIAVTRLERILTDAAK